MKDRTCLKCDKTYDSLERNKENNYHPNCRGKCTDCLCEENPNMFIFEQVNDKRKEKVK